MATLFSQDELQASQTDEVIRSVYDDQAKLLMAITALYGPIQYDATYSDGMFWRDLPEFARPTLRSDILPKGDFASDFTALPLRSRSISSMMLDPPFLHGASPGLADLDENSNKMERRFSAYRTQDELRVSYHGALVEAKRALIPGGILIFKCQDIVECGRQVWNHCHVWQMATNLGFEMEDLFVLVAHSRLTGGNHQRQIHARKFNSFFLVFRKENRYGRRSSSDD